MSEDSILVGIVPNDYASRWRLSGDSTYRMTAGAASIAFAETNGGEGAIIGRGQLKWCVRLLQKCNFVTSSNFFPKVLRRNLQGKSFR